MLVTVKAGLTLLLGCVDSLHYFLCVYVCVHACANFCNKSFLFF